MPQFLITYKDYSEELPITKEITLYGKDVDDVECHLFRKINGIKFTILNVHKLTN
jgi:hypothetical protein